MTISVKVNGNYKITVPKIAREKLNIKQGDRLLVDVQNGVMILIPQPKRHTEYFQGLHSEIWKGFDIQKYLNEERHSWTIQRATNEGK